MLKKAGPAGPPGYRDAPAPAGVTGVTTSDWATVAAPLPEPEPEADHVANATPVPSPRAAVDVAIPMNSFSYFMMCSFVSCRRCRSGVGTTRGVDSR
jgi:hypothetical protein